MILILIVTACLAALRIAAAGAIMARLHEPYGSAVLHLIGAGLAVGGALVLDRLVRRFFWDGYLRRRRNRETPALIEDIVTAALVVLGLSIGLYFEEGLSITSIVTASGATAIILGIALQAVIQDLFSGLSINLDRSYALGDWLTVYSDQLPEPVYGCVSGITWRTTFLTLEDGRRLMVPNHSMTASPVLNHSRPLTPKRYWVEVSADNRIPSARVRDVLLGEAFKVVRAQGFASQPDPSVIFDRLTGDGCYFRVFFYAYPGRVDDSECRSLMLTALHDTILQNELGLPVQQVELTPAPDLNFDVGEKDTRAALTRAPLFSRALNAEQIAELAAQCSVAEFPRGAVLMRQGDPPASMYVILEGAVSIAVGEGGGEAGGESREVAASATGDVVGEMSLMTGAPRTATVTALTKLRALEISKSDIEILFQKTPALAERFSTVLAQRQHELDEIAHLAARRTSPEKDILARMKRFFSRAFGVSA